MTHSGWSGWFRWSGWLGWSCCSDWSGWFGWSTGQLVWLVWPLTNVPSPRDKSRRTTWWLVVKKDSTGTTWTVIQFVFILWSDK